VPACTVLGFTGEIAPVVVDGVAPAGLDDVALGANTAERADVGIGDAISLTTPSGPRTMQVVGIVVGPASPTPGDAAMTSPEAVTQLGATTDLFKLDGVLVLDIADGLDLDETMSGLAADHPIGFTADAIATPPEFLVQLQRLRPVFLSLVAFVAVLGAAGMLHFLVLSVSRRRRETAVLQSLGFVRRQVRVVIGWQAAAVAALGICAGVPIGLVVGRWVWLALVDHLGMIDTPAVPWAALVLVPVAVLVGAGVLALVPAWRAARVRPSVGLRGE
jgi:putative ABC transport system permease protein